MVSFDSLLWLFFHGITASRSATLRALTDLYSSKHITTVDREHLRILLRCFLKNGADLKEVDEVLAECESQYNVTFDEGMLITLLMVWWLCAEKGRKDGSPWRAKPSLFW